MRDKRLSWDCGSARERYCRAWMSRSNQADGWSDDDGERRQAEQSAGGEKTQKHIR